MTDALVLPVREIGTRLRSGDLTPTLLLDRLLARIDATEPAIAAYTTIQRDVARGQAAQAERELHEGVSKGPLHGVPISVKDLIDTRGLRTTYGSPIYHDHVPTADAAVVRRLRDAGAVLVGKTNTHEFALGASTPPTRNPFDLERIPGGSSGGSAAAVAAGSAIVALGTDTGGSIRIPASYCGVVGLKPTYGLVSRHGVFPESWSLDHIGPITRWVEDAAILMNVISGHDPDDPNSVEQQPSDFCAELDRGLEGVAVGVPANHFYEGLEPDVRTATHRALDDLAAGGAELREVTFPNVDEILASHAAIDLAEIATNHRRTYAEHFDAYLPETKPYIELGFFVRVTTYIDAMRARPRLLHDVLESMAGVDVLAVPAQPIVAPSVGARTAVIDGREEDVLAAMVRFLAPFNLTGQPALTVPCGFDGRGLPIGLQLVGRPLGDGTVLRVGHAYQVSTSWMEPLLAGAVPPAREA